MWCRRETDGKILDILDKTMKNMRGNLTSKDIDRVGHEEDARQHKGHNFKAKRTKPIGAEETQKIYAKSWLQRVTSMQTNQKTVQRRARLSQQKFGQLQRLSELLLKMLEQYKGRNVGHQMEQILAAYQDDAKLAKVQEERAKIGQSSGRRAEVYELQMQQLLAALQEAKTPEEKARIQKQIDET
ncbi:Hypothetical_protein [Hexamita inflata]|uniref:Hypothetical_protein n=1 Tax=Hexamita inflata TaxID=28002 RepID=A0AA86QB86_9EUKA|nr:Hypothetical protein HINF_LOCUS43609 [Hexamita inflata]